MPPPERVAISRASQELASGSRMRIMASHRFATLGSHRKPAMLPASSTLSAAGGVVCQSSPEAGAAKKAPGLHRSNSFRGSLA